VLESAVSSCRLPSAMVSALALPPAGVIEVVCWRLL
jgi:hypothetical protein